jgi:hypothetical protein
MLPLVARLVALPVDMTLQTPGGSEIAIAGATPKNTATNNTRSCMTVTYVRRRRLGVLRGFAIDVAGLAPESVLC